MKAVVNLAEGEGNIDLIEVDRPVLGPSQVEVEIQRAAICGTDIQIWHGKHKTSPPVTLGHECCGVVSRVGQLVDDWRPGERVTLETAAKVCGRCLYCREGNYQLCVRRQGLGTRSNGAFARYCVVRPDILHRLPDNVSYRSGALSNPLSVAIRAVSDHTRIRAGDVTVVSGPGGIGLLVLQIAKLQGATVLVLGLAKDRQRLEVAKELGADVVINVEEEDPSEVVNETSRGYGADVVLECAGTAPSVDQCLRLVRKRGRYTQIGVSSAAMSVHFATISSKELTVVGSYGHEWTAMERANRLLGEKRVNVERLVSHEYPITEWRKGFEMMESGVGLRILLYPVD